MGREVATAYRRRKCTFASLSPSPSRDSSATDSSMESLPANLTPARKHHKLQKDGSEVWSKDVEKIFVQGLRQYWQSPWATYSRGRSRWRNQFLVDHLKQNGIVRTKKQVASHIQVLRNMWRGQPEFHLVAGGEELFQENGLLAPTANKRASSSPRSASTSQLDLPASSPSAGSSSPSSTPEYATSEFASDFPSTTPLPSLSPPSHLSLFPDLGVDDVFATSAPPMHAADTAFSGPSSSTYATQTITPRSVKLEPLAMDPTLFSLPSPSFAEPPINYTISMPNRLSNLYFWADGMRPLSIDVDRIVGANPASPSRPFLHLRVSMPHVADLRCPPNLQGINGAVSFSSPWSSLAKCQTKSWGAGRTVISQDLGLFTQVTTPELHAGPSADTSSSQNVYSYLPNSALTRCHWLDTVHTITQQIVVDNDVLAVLVYHVDRVADASRPVPAIELLGFQKYPWRNAPPSAASSSGSAFQLLASPPISPQSPTFSQANANAYSSAPVPPESPLFTRVGVPTVPGGAGSVIDTRMMYTYPPPRPFGFHPPH